MQWNSWVIDSLCYLSYKYLPLEVLLCSMWWLHWLDPLSHECCILGCQEGRTSGPYLLPCLMVEWAGLQEVVVFDLLLRGHWAEVFLPILFKWLISLQWKVVIWWVLVLLHWQLMNCILVWVVSSSFAMEDGFLFIMDRIRRSGVSVT